MISVPCDGYTFNFEDAIDAFKFDQNDPGQPHYHGVPMKAVDIIAEFDNAYVFIELKELNELSEYDIATATNEEEAKQKNAAFKWLKNYLKYKYRDSYLYRYAEDKVDKPVHYICLLNFDNSLCSKMKKFLAKELPVGHKSRRWNHIIASSCQVMNMQRWETEYPKWKITPQTTNGN